MSDMSVEEIKIYREYQKELKSQYNKRYREKLKRKNLHFNFFQVPNDTQTANETNKLKLANPATVKRLETKSIASPSKSTKSNNNKIVFKSQTSEKTTGAVEMSFETNNNLATIVQPNKLKQYNKSNEFLIENESLDLEIAEELSLNTSTTSIVNSDNLTNTLNNDPNCAELLLKEITCIKQTKRKLLKSMQEQIQLMNKYCEVSENYFTILNEIKNSMIETKRTMSDLKETVNLMSSNQTQAREVFYKGKNLVLKLPMKKNKFITKTMTTLFSSEELREGYVIEGPSSSSYKPLDLDRIALLKQAFFAKFRVEPQNEETEWAEMLLVAKRKCSDSRKAKKQADSNTTNTVSNGSDNSDTETED